MTTFAWKVTWLGAEYHESRIEDIKQVYSEDVIFI
jgi:hypothetical protein